MKLLLILFSFFGVYCLQAQSMAKHFIVIGIDGMSPDGIRQANTPEIDKLIRDGASTMYARAVLSTSSSQNWASMVMGAGPEQHGITSNGWERNEAPFPPVVAGPEGIFPTIFCELRKQNPDAEIGIIYDWDGFGRLCEKTCINYVVDADGEDKTTTIAEAYIKKSKPNYLFIHIDNVDDAGHGSGHGSKAYYKAVEKADSLIGRIIQALADAKILEESVILVTADHGGKGHGHGGESLEELEIPFILYGKNVKKGKEIKHPVYQYDNAATAVFVLGITPPYAWIGRPTKALFTGRPIQA
jgi:predicted AlkP superfamily pyrophosphatase or phosphodiesterase